MRKLQYLRLKRAKSSLNIKFTLKHFVKEIKIDSKICVILLTENIEKKNKSSCSTFNNIILSYKIVDSDWRRDI